jgi:tetratricopeptide (TPR) repeat protein
MSVLLLLLFVLGCATNPEEIQRLQAGYDALDQRQYDQAIAAADNYLAENPQGPGAAAAAYLRGRAVYARVKPNAAASQADIQEARNRYLQALAASPSPALEGLIHADLANIAYHQDQFAVAEREWSAAYENLDKDPIRGVVLFQIARCRQRLSRWAEADKLYAQIQQAYPNTDLAKSAAEKQGYTGFWVQTAAYARAADADKAVVALAAWRAQGLQVIRKSIGSYFVVLVGPRDFAAARILREQLAKTYKDAFVRP